MRKGLPVGGPFFFGVMGRDANDQQQKLPGKICLRIVLRKSDKEFDFFNFGAAVIISFLFKHH
jgi:hypothetical protein